MKSALMISASMLAMMVGQAKADVITYGATCVEAGCTSSGPGEINLFTWYTTAANFPLFDSGLGTLQSATISASGITDNSNIFYHPMAPPPYGTVTITPWFSITVPSEVQGSGSSIQYKVTYSPSTVPVQYTGFAADYQVEEPFDVTIPIDPLSQFIPIIPTFPGEEFEVLLNTGFTNYSSSEYGTFQTNFGGEGEPGTYILANLTITYDYTPTSVPEPVSLATFGLGLLGVGYQRYRRRFV